MAEILDVGIHFGISPDRYHEDPCAVPSLSSSLAHAMVAESPAHAWLQHPRLGKPKADPETYEKKMARGSVMHALMLGVDRRIVLVEAKDFRTKAAKEARDHALANGTIPVLADDLNAWNTACGAVRERLRDEWELELTGRSEVVIVWREIMDDGTEILCRCQMDHLLVDDWNDPRVATIIDLKFSGEASEDFVERQWVPMGYDIQREAYVRAVEHWCPGLIGRVEFKLAFCEPTTPFAVTVSRAGGMMRELGNRRWRRALNRWERCRRTDDWPTYTNREVVADPKQWEFEREMYRGE